MLATKPRILVTGAGGAAAIVLLHHLRDRATLHAADIDPLAAGLYRVQEGRRHLVPRGDSGHLVPALLRLCKAHRIEVLIPTVDSELLEIARRRAEFEALGTRVLVASAGTLEVCLDKVLLCEALAPIAPRTAVLDPDFDGEGWSFPLLVKPRDGAGGRGIRTIEDCEALETMDRRPNDMVQEFLPGAEYSVDVLRLNGEILAAVPRERMKVDSGVAVAARTVRDPLLERHARIAAEAIGLEGAANVQLRRNQRGVPLLMEINPRFPGTLSITIAAGADLPGAWLAHVLEGVTPAPMPFREVAMVRTWSDHLIGGFLEPAAEAAA